MIGAYSGISYGKNLSPIDWEEFSAARARHKTVMKTMLAEARWLSKDQMQNCQQMVADSQKVLDKYEVQSCGLKNNIVIHLRRYVLNGSEPAYSVLAWVPAIFLREAMLPTLYQIISDLMENDMRFSASQGLFIDDIVYLK